MHSDRHIHKKRFGQHFLHDANVLARIVQAVAPKPGERVVKAAFGQRRKTLANALYGVLPAEQIDRAGVDPRARAEQLAPAAFVELARIAGLPDNPPP